MLVSEGRGFGGVYVSCVACRCGVWWFAVGVPAICDASGIGRRDGVSTCGRCGVVSWDCACRGEPSSRGPALTPRRPRCSGVLTGEGEAPVGSLGSGRRLMGVLSRGPPTAGLWPSGRAASFLFSTTGFSALGRVS